MKRLFYASAMLLVLLAVLISVFNSGLYPILKINGHLIWAEDYYGRFAGFKQYRQATAEPLDEKAVNKGLILSFIADALITEEFGRRGVGANEAEKRVDEVLRVYGGDLEKAVPTLYGWGIEEFKKFSLFPQARQDILTEVLQKEGVDFDGWLLAELDKAKEKIYFLPYRWQDGQ